MCIDVANMSSSVGIGIQDFLELRENHNFYIDKTSFIKEWWESNDSVTLITRPRRFGKTLNMSMIEEFFSMDYAGRGDLFEGLSIWEEEKYQKLQGTYPVISLSFARVKETDFESTKRRIIELLMLQFEKYAFLTESDKLLRQDRRCTVCPIICLAIMKKRSFFFWMSMIPRCKRPMFMDFGRRWWHL